MTFYSISRQIHDQVGCRQNHVVECTILQRSVGVALSSTEPVVTFVRSGEMTRLLTDGCQPCPSSARGHR